MLWALALRRVQNEGPFGITHQRIDACVGFRSRFRSRFRFRVLEMHFQGVCVADLGLGSGFKVLQMPFK